LHLAAVAWRRRGLTLLKRPWRQRGRLMLRSHSWSQGLALHLPCCLPRHEHCHGICGLRLRWQTAGAAHAGARLHCPRGRALRERRAILTCCSWQWRYHWAATERLHRQEWPLPSAGRSARRRGWLGVHVAIVAETPSDVAPRTPARLGGGWRCKRRTRWRRKPANTSDGTALIPLSIAPVLLTARHRPLKAVLLVKLCDRLSRILFRASSLVEAGEDAMCDRRWSHSV